MRRLNRYKVRDTVAEWRWEFCKWEKWFYIRSVDKLLSQLRNFRIGVMCWILEPGQQFEQEHSECVGDYLFDILEDRSIESYSSLAWSVRWRWQSFLRCKIKVGTDTGKSADVTVGLARFRQCRDLIGEWEMFIKYEAKVASRLSSVYWSRRVVNLCQLPFKSY